MLGDYLFLACSPFVVHKPGRVNAPGFPRSVKQRTEMLVIRFRPILALIAAASCLSLVTAGSDTAHRPGGLAFAGERGSSSCSYMQYLREVMWNSKPFVTSLLQSLGQGKEENLILE